MKLKTIIYTTSRSQWIKAEFSKIYSTLKRTRGVQVYDFKTVYFRLPGYVPLERRSNGGVYIDWDWFKKNLPKENNNAVCLHISRRERDKIGMKHSSPGKSLGGVYDKNSTDAFRFVVIADRYGESYAGMSDFERIFIHELSHGFAHWRGVIDYTHLWDYTIKNMKGIFYLHDFTMWNSLVAQLKKLQDKVAELIASADKIHPPLEPQFMEKVTQPFGVPNPVYPTTRHHVGVDFAVPVGENCFAPADGIVSHVVTDHPLLGNATYYEFLWNGKVHTARFLHQEKPGTMGYKKRGDYVGITGNTGMSTGPHLHFDICRGRFDLTGVNQYNFRDKFIDPLTL